MSDFASRLTEILSQPLLPWLILAVIVVGVLLDQVGKHVPEARHRFSQTGWLNALGWFAVLFSPILFLLFLSVLAMLAQVGWRILTGDTMQGEADNLRWYVLSFVGLLTALGGIIGTPLALIRVWTTERQTKTAEQGHITDRINKAVEGLGAVINVKKQRTNSSGTKLFEDKQTAKPDQIHPTFGVFPSHESGPKTDFKRPIYEEITEPNLEVRIGALFSLERIAQDSLRDHLQIMEIICAYVRSNAPQTTLDPREPPYFPQNMRPDIQTAIKILGRRNEIQKKLEIGKRFRLDLRMTDLSGCDFSKGDFSAAILSQCRLEACRFDRTQLHGSIFVQSLLNGSTWWKADLTGACLDLVILNRPIPTSGGMANSINFADTIRGISVCGADLTAIDYLGEADVTNDTFGSSDTDLHPDLDEKRNDLKRLRHEHRRAERGHEGDPKVTEDALKKTGFMDWCPFTRDDLARGHYRAEQLKRLKLDRWPYNLND